MSPIKNLALVTVLACGAAAPAVGQCSLYRWNVPDFDQKRSGLPGDGGMHCVPTSAVNWMAYIANHGYAPMMSGPRNWQSQSNHAFVTTTDLFMGTLMGTTAADGTYGGPGLSGLKFYMQLHAPFKFTASAWYGKITPFDLYFQMLSNGLVNVCYGYYKEFPGVQGPFYARDGGHCVTLNGVVNVCASGVHPTIRVRNPADDNDLFVQSAFSTAVSRGIIETFPSGPLPWTTSTLTRMADFGVNSTTRRYLDTMFVIRSNFNCWAPATNQPQIKLTKAVTLFGDSQPQEVTFTLTPGAVANALAIHPDQTKAAYVERTPGASAAIHRLRLLNLADGSDQDLGLLLPAVQGKTPIAFDRFGNLVVCDGSVLKVLDVTGRAPVVVASRTLAAPASSICFDDALDEVVVLTPANGRLIRFSKDLDSAIDQPLPTGVPALGDGSVVPDPTRAGRYLLITPADAIVRELELIPGTPRFTLAATLLLPAVQSIQDIQPGDGGVFVLGDGSVRVLDRDPDNGRLRISPTQVFDNLPPMRCMSLSRSRTNFDPALHSGPGWVNLPNADEGVTAIPDCPADFNLDGLLTVQDLFDFLNGYFSSNPQADVNGSASITVQDIFDFIAIYFAGCR